MKRLVLVLCLLLPHAAGAVMLTATTETLELSTSVAGSVDYYVAFADHTSSTLTPGSGQGNISTATTTTILAAPAASTQRQLKWLSVRNRSTTASNVVTVKKDVSATEYHLTPAISLAVGEQLYMDGEGRIQVLDASGRLRTQASDVSGYSGGVATYQKFGTAKDAAGYWIAYGKDTGAPSTYTLGTPGLNGVNTDCSLATSTTPAGASNMGANYLPDPASGGWYLTAANITETVVEALQMVDVLWYNTGAVVTTTTGQTVTMGGALPARDVDGSTNGRGVLAALLVTAATTNAGVITNTTITYTDQDGNAGNTGVFAASVGWQAPATAVIGTWMPFLLAAGDTGIRSVQTLTLGTSYATGSLSLVLYRPLVTIPLPAAYANGVAITAAFTTAPGVRLYNDTCIWGTSVGSAGAANLIGTYNLMER